MDNYIHKLEALLFLKGETLSKDYLIKSIGCSRDSFSEIVLLLKEKYTDHSICVIESENELGLATRQEVASFVEEIEKEEKGGELTKSSLETLAIILYKNGATRSDIDYVRGVNSSFILRNLYLRGLIERKEKEGDARTFVYTATPDLLRFLGISSVSELPDFSSLFESISQKTQLEQESNE